MAYMDVAPSVPNGRTAVLLHGANFCAATWGETIEVLRQAGYRVVAPDQIGFCKSSKPESYQFSLQQLAANTNELLTSLGIKRATIFGHSMGGMLAIRYALMFPDAVEQLVLVDPLGLEDWQAQGVPFIPLDQSYRAEMRTSFDGIKQYQQKFYYGGEWKPEYDRWVDMLGGMYAGPGTDIVAWSRARVAEMIFTQPVVYELDHIPAANPVVDRPEGPHCARRDARSLGSCGQARKLSGARARGGQTHSAGDPGRVSRAGTCSPDPGAGPVSRRAIEGTCGPRALGEEPARFTPGQGLNKVMPVISGGSPSDNITAANPAWRALRAFHDGGQFIIRGR